MRAVGDESRPPCHKKKGSLLSCEHPSKLFDSQDSVGRRWCSFRWKLRLKGTAHGEGLANSFIVFGAAYCNSRCMTEKVKVLLQNGIQEMEIASLPEGNRLEYYAAKQFLELYNENRSVRYAIDLLQDSPDVACVPQPFYIEVATVFDKPTDAPKMLGRAEGAGGVRELHEAINQINRILSDKASKRYGVANCVLVIRHGVPIFSGDDFRLHADEFVVPATHDFSEIYLLAFREENGLLHVGQDLIRLFPEEC